MTPVFYCLHPVYFLKDLSVFNKIYMTFKTNNRNIKSLKNNIRIWAKDIYTKYEVRSSSETKRKAAVNL